MAYKIAVASSDGRFVDIHFGTASFFYVYDVSDHGEFVLGEVRNCDSSADEGNRLFPHSPESRVCASGGKGACAGQGNCCGGEGPSARVLLISDVRAVVAASIGFNVCRQLEKRAISSFDVSCSVEEALEKITQYFYRLDSRLSKD